VSGSDYLFDSFLRSYDAPQITQIYTDKERYL